MIIAAPITVPSSGFWNSSAVPMPISMASETPFARAMRNSRQIIRTVFELVKDAPGLTYVGRLDYLTEGLLLLTTDGEAAHRLTHPSTEVERTYVATVRGNAGAAVRALREGVELEDGLVTPTEVAARSLGRGHWELELTIAEGRNREVRRLCDAVGLEVEKLVRTRFGPVRLGALEPGKARPLTTRERDLLGALGRPELKDPATRRRR